LIIYPFMELYNCILKKSSLSPAAKMGLFRKTVLAARPAKWVRFAKCS
jgi:hypothetical protein